MALDEKTATPEELWEYYMGKYKNQNPIARWLTNGFFDQIASLIKAFPNDYRILEVGCGPGESTRRILTMLDGQHLEASEFEQRLVDLHQKFGFPVPLRQESVYELQREENEFDCVMLLEVLEHLEDYELALSEIFRVAKKHVIVSVPNEPLWRILNFMRGKYWSDFGNTPGHINHWSASGLKTLVAQHGKIVQVLKPLPWTIILAKAHD
ncbi:MAG: class I SAM-dependent methyltransferase [Pseudomonadales bacterium]|nr:class I SAM-dependent methyltransferase [Pseudomonadales bacterium]